MGYPMTTFDLYADGEYSGSINLVGDMTSRWAEIVDVVSCNFPNITTVRGFRMDGSQFIEVTL